MFADNSEKIKIQYLIINLRLRLMFPLFVQIIFSLHGISRFACLISKTMQMQYVIDLKLGGLYVRK